MQGISCGCSVAQSCRLSVTPRAAACQASLPFTISRSMLKLMSIKSVMPFNHLILCNPFLLHPSILPSISVFFNDTATTEIYTLSLHDALPILLGKAEGRRRRG